MFIDPKRIPPTGNQSLDAAHARLALVINQAYDQWRRREPRETLLNTFSEFLSMVSAHFTEEVRTIRDAGYSQWENHQKIHFRFLGDLTKLVDEIREGGEDVLTLDTFTLLDRLLYEHEFLDDQEFWETFQGERPETERGDRLLIWSDEFLTGDEAIDRQHMALAKLLNRLHLAVEKEAPKEEILVQLGEIMKHTQWHFHYEEELMKADGFKGFEAHRMLHENLLADLTKVAEDFAEDKYDMLEDLLENYLKYWLLDHIVNVDKGLGRHLARVREQGER